MVDNENYRIDSSFFKKQFVLEENLIKKDKWNYLENLCKSIVNFGAYSLCNHIKFLDSGVPYLNVSEIKENFIEWENAKKIDENLSENLLHKSLVKKNQVLLTIAGTIGNASVAYDVPLHTNSNQAIANITLKEDINPFYLSTYLNSYFGKGQTNKLTISSVQPNLLLTQVKKIKIPIFSPLFQKQIEDICKKGYHLRNEAQNFYHDTEKLLLQELDLENFVPDSNSINIKNFSESFLKSDRLDAEFYQPKYEEFFKHLSHFCCKPLGGEKGLVKLKKSIEPGSEAYQEKGIPFIRVSDITKFEITNTEIHLDPQKYDLEKLCPKKDTILLSKDGSIGIAYKISNNDKKIITSGALLHLIIKDKNEVLPDYLTLVLNSLVVQIQAEHDADGSIIKHWKPSEIEKIKIPILKFEKQNEIAELIQESFSLRKKSKILLEVAKKAVEIAIEVDEQKALEYIKIQIPDIDM